MDRKLVLKRFKEVEKLLLKKLKSSSINFSDNDDEQKIKLNIKSHIKTLGEIKALFSEYELLAKKLQDYDDGDEQKFLSKNEEHSQKPNKIQKINVKNTLENKSDKKSVKKEVDLSTNFSK